MKRIGIKYMGNKDRVTQVVKTMPREAPDRLVTFSKGEIKVIGDDITDLAARHLISSYPTIYGEVLVDIDDLTYAEEYLKGVKEDLMQQGLKEEEFDVLLSKVFTTPAGKLRTQDELDEVSSDDPEEKSRKRIKTRKD